MGFSDNLSFVMFENMGEWLNANTLFASVIWGGLGGGYFIYGWKQRKLIPALGGIAMSVISMVVANWLWMSLLSIGVMVAVWFLLRQEE